tara:strand:+ start:58 stop:612 length:555 start_codon:yes stop_codon:yes gene_type:complete
MAISNKNVTLDGLVYSVDERDRVAAQVAVENTPQGASSPYFQHVQYVDNTTAFVRNADSIVEWTQPANTVITGIHLFFPSSTYSTGTGNDLGFEVGTSSSGAQIVATQSDQIIDAGADGTDIATGAFITTTLVAGTEDDTTLAANVQYSGTSSRSVYLNTTCSNAAAVTTAGTVRWIIEYITVA